MLFVHLTAALSIESLNYIKRKGDSVLASPKRSIEDEVKFRHLEAFRIIQEKVSEMDRSSNRKKKESLSSKVDDFCNLSKEEMLKVIKRRVL